MRSMEREMSDKNFVYKELEKKKLEQLKNNRRTATEIYLSDDVYVPESHLWTVPEMQRGAIKYFCDRAGGCQSPDYVACSVSGLGVGAGIVKNLHAKLDKGWYISTSKSALEHITKEKLEQIAKAKNINLSGSVL